MSILNGFGDVGSWNSSWCETFGESGAIKLQDGQAGSAVGKGFEHEGHVGRIDVVSHRVPVVASRRERCLRKIKGNGSIGAVILVR